MRGRNKAGKRFFFNIDKLEKKELMMQKQEINLQIWLIMRKLFARLKNFKEIKKLRCWKMQMTLIQNNIYKKRKFIYDSFYIFIKFPIYFSFIKYVKHTQEKQDWSFVKDLDRW